VVRKMHFQGRRQVNRRAGQLVDKCRCSRRTGVILVATFGGDGLSCFDCNLDVAASSIGVGPDDQFVLHRWRDAESALYSLWTASGSLESFAALSLRDEGTWTNQLRRTIRRRIGRRHRCWMQLFQSTSDQEFGRPHRCPSCGLQPELIPVSVGPRLACRRCWFTWFPAEGSAGRRAA